MAQAGSTIMSLARFAAPDERGAEHRIELLSVPQRVRAIIDARAVVDSLHAALLIESGSRPTYYFRRDDLRADLLTRGSRRTRCPYKGEATYWSMTIGSRRFEDALWSYESPPAALDRLRGYLAFAAGKVDRWYEEDEETFGHPRDPYHRVDIRQSSRRVRVIFSGERVAETQRGLFLFETGLPTRYYIPPPDVRMDLLAPSPTRSVCPYKGRASYWSLRCGGQVAPDAAWSYLDPLPECPRIKGYLCFYPEKVERIEVEGEGEEDGWHAGG